MCIVSSTGSSLTGSKSPTVEVTASEWVQFGAARYPFSNFNLIKRDCWVSAEVRSTFKVGF